MMNKKPITNFKMDRGNVKFIDLNLDAEIRRTYWLSRSVEERFFAIEFLRHQYMEMNNIEPVMDKKHFDILGE